jgi:hypothetical protein
METKNYGKIFMQYGNKTKIPENWQIAIICPTHKRGDKQ